ncbi:uncharacterized protein MYCFIDRAFT_175855 [Pseudocercospora fijiensis CIRAD86]|uniref:Uncharacterized protein n=1 Tax=Pseudocercospora fijiensis (strain CIRAD86) TaxID=383855 RepID=M3AYP9_PSEFD|nr:uncharacterized protein MYCFIDRAFT_175855 [Pseudocercospora fijiensis CIRAD86]EME82312.1 hypothetical protein MYCFIDRAFT_175855 [Pseudocercospora fijiensis CIRAD86]
MAPLVKRKHREHSVVPRLDQRRGGGGGGSSRSTQYTVSTFCTNNDNHKLPDWVFYSNADIMHYFKCDEVELRILRAHLKDFMERNDYDGKPFPTTWEEDRNRPHFHALWNRMAAHSEVFEEMLSGARWEGNDEKPRDLATKISNCKKKLGLPWKSTAARARNTAERKRLADEKEERREARREKKRRARRAAKARESSSGPENEAYPAYGRNTPVSGHEERPYPAYGRTSPEPTYLEEGICPDFGDSTATPSTGRQRFFSARPSMSRSLGSSSKSRSPRAPVYDPDSDIEEVDPPPKRKPNVIVLDDSQPILAFKKEVAETMDLDDLEDGKPFANLSLNGQTIDLTGRDQNKTLYELGRFSWPAIAISIDLVRTLASFSARRSSANRRSDVSCSNQVSSRQT